LANAVGADLASLLKNDVIFFDHTQEEEEEEEERDEGARGK